jgi:hypothetical protein
MFFAVRLKRGGPWDGSRDLREQVGWDECGRFMDSLVDDGFIVLGRPLAGEREILHAVSAPSEQVVRERLAQDNWAQNGMLTIKSIEPRTILLDGEATWLCPAQVARASRRKHAGDSRRRLLLGDSASRRATPAIRGRLLQRVRLF